MGDNGLSAAERKARLADIEDSQRLDAERLEETLIRASNEKVPRRAGVNMLAVLQLKEVR